MNGTLVADPRPARTAVQLVPTIIGSLTGVFGLCSLLIFLFYGKTQQLRMAEASLASLWEDAIAKYEKATESQLEAGSLQSGPTGLRNLEAYLEALHDSQGQFSTHRQENRRVIAAFRKFILPLQFVLDAADRGLQGTPVSPVSALLFAFKQLLTACANVSKAYDAVEELFQRVAAVTSSLEGYKESSLVGSHQTVVVEVLSCLLRLIGLAQTKVINPSRLRQFGRSLFKNDEEINKCLAELERRIGDELGYVMRLNFGMTQQMRETNLTIQQDVLEIKNDISKSKGDHVPPLSSAATSDIAVTLKNESEDEIRKHHRRAVDTIATATATWIQGDSMFAAWEDGNGSVLWVFGRPGVGKTVLAAATIEALRVKHSSRAEDHPARPVGYLYFKENQPKLQNLSHMLLAVALQVAKQDERFHKHLIDAVTAYPDILGKSASAESLWDRLFLSYDPHSQHFDDVHEILYLIVDGLDEADKEVKQAFLICLKRLLASQPSYDRASIQVAVFARPEIRDLLESADEAFQGNEKMIDITEDKTRNDIRAYVKQKTKQIAAVKVVRKLNLEQGLDFEAFIEESIVEKSQGMFLWAKLVLDQIRDSPSVQSVQESLDGAPSGLMDVIHMVFLRLNSEDEIRTQYLTHLLAWVLCCRRPLTILELYICLIETVGQNMLTISDDLTHRYSSLFEVVQNTNDDAMSSSFRSQKSETQRNSEDESEIETDEDDIPSDYTPVRSTTRHFSLKKLSIQANNGIFEDWHRSTVTFAHAKIRDYLEREGNPLIKTWDDCRVVPGHIDRFKMQMVRALLDLATKPIVQKYGVHLLKEYAEANCVSHLLEIDLAAMPEDLCGPVGARLASLCFDGERFYQTQNGQWHTTIDTWLMDKKKTTIVRALVGQSIAYLDEDETDVGVWAQQAVGSARILLQPLINKCARLWLSKSSWDDPAWFNKCDEEIWMLVAYEYLTADGENTGPVDILRGTRRVGRVTLELIEHIAKSQKLPEDEYWLTGVAWTMMQGANAVHTKRAIKYFQKAIITAEDRTRELYGEVVPKAWIAYEGLSRCYGDNLRQPPLAVPIMEKAIKALPQHCVELGVGYYFKARMAIWQLQMGEDANAAITVCREAYERCQSYTFGSDPPSDDVIADSIKLYLDILSRIQDYAATATVLGDIATRATVWPGYSLLSCFLRHKFSDQEFKHITGIIAMTLYTTPVPVLEEHLRDNFRSIAYVDKSSKPNWADLRLATRSAQFLHCHFKDTAGAIKVHKSILVVIDSSDEAYRQRMSSLRDQSAAFLSLCRFTEVVQGRLLEQHAHSPAEQKLRALALREKRQYRAAYSALLYGVWLRDHRRRPWKSWRQAFQPSISEAIYKLHDEDPWNDDDAYDQLGEALMMGGDFENAAIAFGIVMTTTDGIPSTFQATHEESVADRLQPQRAPTGGLNGDGNCTQIYRCDGICDPNKEDFAELWCCSICNKTWLCGDCLRLLNTQDPKKDRYVICSETHKHLRVYPLSEQAENISKALKGGDFDEHRRWLRKVQKDWNVGSFEKSESKR